MKIVDKVFEVRSGSGGWFNIDIVTAEFVEAVAKVKEVMEFRSSLKEGCFFKTPVKDQWIALRNRGRDTNFGYWSQVSGDFWQGPSLESLSNAPEEA